MKISEIIALAVAAIATGTLLTVTVTAGIIVAAIVCAAYSIGWLIGTEVNDAEHDALIDRLGTAVTVSEVRVMLAQYRYKQEHLS